MANYFSSDAVVLLFAPRHKQRRVDFYEAVLAATSPPPSPLDELEYRSCTENISRVAKTQTNLVTETRR